MKTFVIGMTFVFLSCFTYANIIYVDDSNTSGIENGSLQYPFNTIEEGLAAAQNQDTIMVAAGSYATSYLLIPKSVTIIGAGRDSTIINGQFVLSSQLSTAPVFIYTLRCENVRFGDVDTITAITPITIQDCTLQTLSDTTKSLDSTCTLLFKNNIVIDSVRIDWQSSKARIEISNCITGDNLSISSLSSRKNILILNNEVGRSVNIWTVSRRDTIFVEQNNISDSLVVLSVSTYPNVIMNNNIGSGIHIAAVSSRGNRIINNVITEGIIKGAFVSVDTTFIESNELLNGGIEFNGVSAKVYILKNVINSPGNKTGINFTSRSGGLIDSNTITLPYLPPTGEPPEFDSLAICAIRVISTSFKGAYNNHLSGGSYGIYLKAVSSKIVRNTIINSDRGIYLEAASCRVDSNSVTNCADDGMIIRSYVGWDTNSIALNYNVITNNGGNGIRLKNFATLGTDTTGFNIIRDNDGYDLYLETPKSLTDTIFAKNNFWSHITEPEISQFEIYDQNDDSTLALVIFTPFLLTDIEDDENNNITPTDFTLFQNYPNPFNPSTKIRYEIPTPPSSSPLAKGRNEVGFVSLKVYDILGNEIATLVDEYKPAGNYEVEFNVKTLRATLLPSGVYFYQLKAGEFVQTKKMLMLK